MMMKTMMMTAMKVLRSSVAPRYDVVACRQGYNSKTRYLDVLTVHPAHTAATSHSGTSYDSLTVYQPLQYPLCQLRPIECQLSSQRIQKVYLGTQVRFALDKQADTTTRHTSKGV